MHRHVKHFVNVLAAISDFKHLGLESRPLALFADQFHIGKKLHFDDNRPIALAGLATPAWHVERKMSGSESAFVCFWSSGKQVTNSIECLDICDWIRPRSAPNRRLVNQNDFVDEFIAFNFTQKREAERNSVGLFLDCAQRLK